MKPRRVLVLLEMLTDEPMEDLRSRFAWDDFFDGYFGEGTECLQVQANVTQVNGATVPEKQAEKRKRKAAK